MHELGIVIWAIVLIAGVVSSIAKSARARTAAPVSRPAPAGGERLAEMRRLAQTIAARPDQHLSPATVARPAAAQPTAGRPARAMAPSPPTLAIAQPAPAWPGPAPSAVRRRALARLVANRHELVDAVIAAEVIGKPLALRNE